ncbi:hypothetical protein B296_00036406 [Ensete ventricosum]|uniref:ubiquitinyl hydrolase 1 n=1 Tax=Ensete ventricosum TaxID=4639 RepID=A0A426YDE1_ENSVE|nr:hypothetical protein B296_00036406 [Ensete ventricosum]
MGRQIPSLARETVWLIADPPSCPFSFPSHCPSCSPSPCLRFPAVSSAASPTLSSDHPNKRNWENRIPPSLPVYCATEPGSVLPRSPEKDSFRRAELDAIAEKLLADDPFRSQWTPLSLIFKPHHNVFTGNYDVNVLIAALESRRKKVVWHDRRNGASSINLAEESLLGIMLNIPVRRFGGIWSGRHWVSLRNINGVWYNLDSDLASPVPFEHQEELREYLNNAIDQGGEILIILREKL